MGLARILALCSMVFLAACKPALQQKDFIYYTHNLDELHADLDYCTNHPYANFCNNVLTQYTRYLHNKQARISSINRTNAYNIWLYIDEPFPYAN